MRLLLHICCGPCAIAVLERLLDAGHEVTGLFFNPNIQPLGEYMRRREGAVETAARFGVPLIMADTLPQALQKSLVEPAAGTADPVPDNDPFSGTELSQAVPPAADPALWLRVLAGRDRKPERCTVCLQLRLAACASLAAERGFEAFSSSLLYSRHQPHGDIRAFGESLAPSAGPAFYYEDFRRYWNEGIRLSKEWGIYRQQYCGCLFSEYDRYARDFARLREPGRN